MSERLLQSQKSRDCASPELTSIQFLDTQADVLSCSGDGSHLVIGGIEDFLVVNLDNPTVDCTYVARPTEYNNYSPVIAIQWNPQQSASNGFIAAFVLDTAHNNGDISLENIVVAALKIRYLSLNSWFWSIGADISLWNIDGNLPTVFGSHRKHTKIVCDLDWSLTSTDKLATCSTDCCTFIWDLRDLKKPQTVLESSIVPAKVVKWNKVHEQLLATVHEKSLRIWDLRLASRPLQYIETHKKTIVCIDWSAFCSTQILSCSDDCSVRVTIKNNWGVLLNTRIELDVIKTKAAILDFWNVGKETQSQVVVSHAATEEKTEILRSVVKGSPFWKAKYTPFGRAVLTVARSSETDSNILLWSLNKSTVQNGCDSEAGFVKRRKQPISVKVGHDDGILDFHWRKLHGGDHQLITWSRNRLLQIWTVDPALKQYCGHGQALNDSGASTDGTLSSDGVQSHVLTDSSVSVSGTGSTEGNSGFDNRTTMSAQQPTTLAQEFSLLNFDKTKVTLEEMSAERSYCTISAAFDQYRVNLTMSFPEEYPNNVPPTFRFNDPGTTLEKGIQQKLAHELLRIAQQQVQHNRSCIESCLRRLVTSLENIAKRSQDSQIDSPSVIKRTSPTFLATHSAEYLRNQQVPFPRTSGARFCGSGYLVCFTRRITEVYVSSRVEQKSEPTPRAMSALLDCTQPKSQPGPPMLYFGLARSLPSSDTPVTLSVADFYKLRDQSQQHQLLVTQQQQLSDWKGRGSVGGSQLRKSSPEDFVTGPVLIYDVFCLLPVDRRLADEYILDARNSKEMCLKNAEAARSIGRLDLTQMWLLAAVECDTSFETDNITDSNDCAPWALHPFGRQLIKSWLEHYSRLPDVQTMAMICYVFGAPRLSSGGKFMAPVKFSTYPTLLCPPTLTGSMSLSRAQKSQPTTPATETGSQQSYKMYHTIHPTDTSLKGWAYTVTKIKRSNSWSESSFEEVIFPGTPATPADVFGGGNLEWAREQHEKNARLLDPADSHSHDLYMLAYANMLYQWGYLNKRAQLLKCLSVPVTKSGDNVIEVMSVCHQCKRLAPITSECCLNKFKHTRKNARNIVKCALCHTPVRGMATFCILCGHGGHMAHMISWFTSHEQCATGCGCSCLSRNIY